MALDLDARQRAILQEMGITVWWPGPAEHAESPPAAPAPALPAAAAPVPAASQVTAEPAATAVPSTTARARTVPTASPPATRAPAAASASPGGADWVLRACAPVALYPDAAADGARWLVVVECPDPAAPLSGDAGRLLDNMLRALQRPGLPHAHCLPLERCPAGTEQPPGTDATALSAAVQALQPDAVLLLGHVPARWALGLAEPLGHLRNRLHQVAGCTAVVSYDPAFLLRSPATKAAAWADLCTALAHLADRTANAAQR
ncbi:uracil-DNA glycosylase family protein [Acidovorax lacteus]|uniref:Uracil-DNA glycosylase-like domain-containing protein n=1 Tax=Acidovorax lacteus TaxID=1924988 RepID=A0ABP8LFP0_9BURK